MSREESIIDKILMIVGSKYPESEIYLYGSRARGDNNHLSDWDLLVLLNSKSVSFKQETDIMDDLYELELETGEIIAPLVYPKSDWDINHRETFLFENIQKQGVKIK